jgi:Protein of unknown function (DUF2934)
MERAIRVERNLLERRGELMKLRSVSTNGESGARAVLQPDIAEEKKNAPSPEEIRKRAFEIHIERGGIHGCDLDDWLQAERELQGKYNESNDQARRSR